jgi:hypothetical protein
MDLTEPRTLVATSVLPTESVAVLVVVVVLLAESTEERPSVVDRPNTWVLVATSALVAVSVAARFRTT